MSMPELPEVEHARRRFLRLTRDRSINDAGSDDALVVTGQTPAEWAEMLRGRRVLDATRAGKNIVVQLDHEAALWFHLGMTGRIALASEEARGPDGHPKFTRWWLKLGDDTLCLIDPRRLGRTHAGSSPMTRKVGKIDELGPDALGLSTATLRERLSTSRSAIKAALMEQERIAGVGNIQAMEALHRARLYPERKPTELSDEEWERLAKGLQDTLEHTLRTMPDDEKTVYVNQGGENPFLVYGREGEPCPECKTPIRKHTSRGRSSYFCPVCQPAQYISP